MYDMKYMNRKQERQNMVDRITWYSYRRIIFQLTEVRKDRSFTNVFICFSLQMTDIYLPLLAGATVYFAQPDALKVSSPLLHTTLSFQTFQNT